MGHINALALARTLNAQELPASGRVYVEMMLTNFWLGIVKEKLPLRSAAILSKFWSTGCVPCPQ